MKSQRLVLFIDGQNFYNGARRAFFSASDSHYYGQINPLELGKLICSRPPPAISTSLKQVRVYTGRPDSTKEPKTYKAHIRQCSVWGNAGVEVISRPLRYPDDWPKSRAEQKGVDVALAVDFVALAIDREYNIGVIAAFDSDLRPALEYVRRKCRNNCRVEVAAWDSPRVKSRLSIPGDTIWCHWIDKDDYNIIADLTDYNL